MYAQKSRNQCINAESRGRLSLRDPWHCNNWIRSRIACISRCPTRHSVFNLCITKTDYPETYGPSR